MGSFALGLTLGLSACLIDTVPLPEANDLGAGGSDGSNRWDPAPGFGGFGGTQAEDDWENFDGTVSGAGPLIDPGGIYWSDHGPFIYLAAVSGTFPGAGLVIIRNPAREDEYRVFSSAAGSMGAVVNAQLFDTLEIGFVQDDVLLDVVVITLDPASMGAYAANADLDENVPPDPSADYTQFSVGVHRSATGDTVTVFGEAGVLAAGIVVVVANLRLAIAERAMVEVDGSFAVIIEAAPGDELLIFTAEPASSNGGGNSVSLIVP